MSIVLNEKDAAEEILAGRSLGRKPMEPLTRVAKYYLWQGYSKQDTVRLLEEFLVQCDPAASVVLWADRLNHAVRFASKFPLVQIDCVPITEKELTTIRGIGRVQTERLAFTLLCVSKYWDIVNPANDHWVNESDTDLMKMSNVNTSIRRQSKMFTDLRDAGLIRFSMRVDNLNVQVLFSDGYGDPALKITDYRNLGFQYLKWLGQPYIECECCGLTVKGVEGKGRPRKYCDACAARRRLEQSVNSVMRLRPSEIRGKK